VPAVRKLDECARKLPRMWRGTAIGPHRCPRQHRHPASLGSRIQGNAGEAPATKGALAHGFSTHRLMHAIEVSATGRPEVLAYMERPVPERSTFDASLASLAVRGTLALYGASSGPVPPVDPQRLNTAGSVYLTRPLRPHFLRTYDEFAWRTDELFAGVQAGTITVTTGDRYRLRDAAQAHSDLEGRKTHGSTVLIP